MRSGLFTFFLILLIGCQPGERLDAPERLGRPLLTGTYQAGAVRLQWKVTNAGLPMDEFSRGKIDPEEFVLEMSQAGPESLTGFRSFSNSTNAFLVEELTNDQPYYFAIRSEAKGLQIRSNVIMIIPRSLPQQATPGIPDTISRGGTIDLNSQFLGAFLWQGNGGPLSSFNTIDPQVLDSLAYWGVRSFLWSPQYDQLAFEQGIGVSNGEKWGHIGIYRPSDQSVFNLTLTEEYYDHQASWSPDGQWLTYISDEQQGSEYHIWKVKADGTIRIPLSEDQGDLAELIHKEWRSPAFPVFSPQGDIIAFERQKPLGDGYVYSLYEIPADGGTFSVLHDSPWNDRKPSYHPSGNRIAFFSDRSGQQEIWLLDRRTQELQQLSGGINMPSPDLSKGLHWSPDGRELLYISAADGEAQLLAVE